MTELLRTLRDAPPSDYVLKIESLSLLPKFGIDRYESRSFEACGHSWKLIFYPKQLQKDNETKFISLYLELDRIDPILSRADVVASFKMFVLNQNLKKYNTIQEKDENSRSRRFNCLTKEWGFSELLHVDEFYDESKGYLINDTCVFGVEIFVMDYTGEGEVLSISTKPSNGVYTWTINNFSSFDDDTEACSDKFTIGGIKWKLCIYPKGYSQEKHKSISLFLCLVDDEAEQEDSKLFAKYVLRIENQLGQNNKEHEDEAWFSFKDTRSGFDKFLPLMDLFNPTGFLVEDSILVEVEITGMCIQKNLH